MTYFVNDLSLYSPKNRACKKLLDFISQFEHVLIKDDCSLDALSSLIEDRIREINTSHPKLRPICYSRNSVEEQLYNRRIERRQELFRNIVRMVH